MTYEDNTPVRELTNDLAGYRIPIRDRFPSLDELMCDAQFMKSQISENASKEEVDRFLAAYSDHLLSVIKPDDVLTDRRVKICDEDINGDPIWKNADEGESLDVLVTFDGGKSYNKDIRIQRSAYCSEITESRESGFGSMCPIWDPSSVLLNFCEEGMAICNGLSLSLTEHNVVHDKDDDGWLLALRPDIANWLEEHCEGDYQLYASKIEGKNLWWRKLRLFFEKETDMLMFMLRWSGVSE